MEKPIQSLMIYKGEKLMDRLEKHRWKLHNKIQQHKGKFGKYMPLEEIQNHIDYIQTFELSTNGKSLLEYYQRQKKKALEILKEKEGEGYESN